MEQQECDDRGGTRGNASREIKGAKELEEGKERRQDGEDVDSGDVQELGWVHAVPMSEFVG